MNLVWAWISLAVYVFVIAPTAARNMEARRYSSLLVFIPILGIVFFLLGRPRTQQR